MQLRPDRNKSSSNDCLGIGQKSRLGDDRHTNAQYNTKLRIQQKVDRLFSGLGMEEKTSTIM